MRIRFRPTLLLIVLLLHSCNDEPAGPEIGRQIEYTPAAAPNLAAVLPASTRGQPVLVASDQFSMEYDASRRGPLTALGACLDFVMMCAAPPERTIDDCVRSTPPCATSQPWDEPAYCCPAACYLEYADHRRAGVPEVRALRAVYFESGRCIPGLAEIVARGSR